MIGLRRYILTASATSPPQGSSLPGSWRFAVRLPDGSLCQEVCEVEPAIHGERLELLAVVRGLEAIEYPAEVLLNTSSRYVRQGLAEGLADWRRNGWRWEAYGRLVPIKHADLWQRVAQALEVHRVVCRELRFDVPRTTPRPHFNNRLLATQQPSATAGLSSSAVRTQPQPSLRLPTAGRSEGQERLPTAGRSEGQEPSAPTSSAPRVWSTRVRRPASGASAVNRITACGAGLL